MQTSELTRETRIGGEFGESSDQSRLTLSSPKEKIMERVRALERQALATQNIKKAEKYKNDYGRYRSFLASQWFLIDFHSLTSKDDRSALELLVCRKAKEYISVYLSVTFVYLGATQYLALISSEIAVDFALYCLSFVLMFFGNVVYWNISKGYSAVQLLLNRWRLKRLGLLETGLD